MEHRFINCLLFKKCVGCKKPLKSGEFVVLNGGAMVKTRANAKVRDGAVMGDHTLAGFLTVMSHFDSRKNYQSMIIEDDGPNGQFEFYACSHKCLADFISKQIMHLAKLDKAVRAKKFEMAPQSKLDRIGYDWGLKVVNLMGFKRALITDESIVGDFLNSPICTDPSLDPRLKKFNKKLGFEIKESDYIWKIAKKYKIAQET